MRTEAENYDDCNIAYYGVDALPQDGETWTDGELIELIAAQTGLPAEEIKLGNETWWTSVGHAGEWFVDGPHVDITRMDTP